MFLCTTFGITICYNVYQNVQTLMQTNLYENIVCNDAVMYIIKQSVKICWTICGILNKFYAYTVKTSCPGIFFYLLHAQAERILHNWTAYFF